MLRTFIYLDEDMLNDFLAQVEGGIIDGTFRLKETNGGNKEAGAGITSPFFNISARGGVNSQSETEMQIQMTGPAKFARLYRYLEYEQTDDGREGIQTLNGFDEAVYADISAGEIVEVRGSSKLADWEKIAQIMEGFKELKGIAQAFGQDMFSDSKTESQFDAFTQLTSSYQREEIGFVITPIGSPQFKFVSQLATSAIRRNRNELEGEVTLLGKVQKKLERGETIDVFRLGPNLSQLPTMNRNQRRAMGKNSKSPIDEVVKYPAMLIQPLAIFR